MNHVLRKKNLEKPKKTVLVISSHVVRGAVGSRTNVAVFERFGCSVQSIMTVSLTWHTQHGPAHRLVVSKHDFAAFTKDILQAPWRHEIDAVVTGYFASVDQVRITSDFVTALKKENSKLIFFCDPIMGNEYGLYIDTQIAEALCQYLLPIASIIKPNRSELEWISGRIFRSNEEIIDATSFFSHAKFLVTSAFPMSEKDTEKRKTGNLLIKGKKAWFSEHDYFENPVSAGLGDLVTSLFLAHCLEGSVETEALQKTSASVYEFLYYTLSVEADELAITNAPLDMRHPKVSVSLFPISVE